MNLLSNDFFEALIGYSKAAAAEPLRYSQDGTSLRREDGAVPVRELAKEMERGPALTPKLLQGRNRYVQEQDRAQEARLSARFHAPHRHSSFTAAFRQ